MCLLFFILSYNILYMRKIYKIKMEYQETVLIVISKTKFIHFFIYKYFVIVYILLLYTREILYLNFSLLAFKYCILGFRFSP